MMPEEGYIHFEEIANPGKKTKRWVVSHADSKEELGEISWFPAWRRYTFTPYEDPVTTYDPSCLRCIADIMEMYTKEHYLALEKAKENK